MKQIILSILLITFLTGSAWSQDEKDQSEKGFKKENLFTGGSLTASFYTGGSVFGVNPMFGYKLANWVDAGVVFNYTHQGERDIYVINDKLRENVYGPGAFVRLFPVRFLFLQGQFEHNFITEKYIDDVSGISQKTSSNANSMLVGAGIAEGRRAGSNTFFYLSVLVDVLKNQNSPYVNNVYESGVIVRTDMIPIFRAGINIGLFQGKYNHGNEERGDGHRRVRNY